MGWRREAGLRVGLGESGPGEHVGDGALAGPGAADDGDVQRRGRLVVEEGAEAVAHQGRRQAQAAGGLFLIGLRPCVSLQKAEIVG